MSKYLRKSTFCLLLLTASAGCEMIGSVLHPNRALIRLPVPMLDVSGRLVDRIQLEPGNGAILRSLPNNSSGSQGALSTNSTNTATAVTDETIRIGKSIRLGGYFFGGFENDKFVSESQLKWISEHLDVLVLNPYNASIYNNLQGGAIKPEQVKWLKQQNKRFKFYSMLFGTTLSKPYFNDSTMSDWVLKNKFGNEIVALRRQSNDDFNHIMDLGNNAYADFFRNYSINHVNEFQADGIAVDEIVWIMNRWGIDIHNLQNYSSDAEVRKACYKWLEQVGKDYPAEIIHQAFWQEAQTYTHGVWGETSFSAYVTGRKHAVFYDSLDWKGVVDNLAEISEKNKTYIWAANYDPTRPASLEYCLTTYLMGKSGNSAVFHPQPDYDGGYPKNLSGYDLQTFQKEYEKNKLYFDVDLGKPVGEMYPEEHDRKGIWIRKYEKGMIYCYPNK